jgi:hypothetical protein
MDYLYQMKLDVEYLNDASGKVRAVQVPIKDWKKVLDKLREYELALQLKSDLQEAMTEVKKLNMSKKRLQTLGEFLNEI